MSTAAKQKIIIIGCGNVAWHIARHLHSLKRYALSIYNHKPNKALDKFKQKLKCQVHSSIDDVSEEASVYFICVSDKYISETASKIRAKQANALILHTSGSAKLEDLGERIHGTGVFYPLQSFSSESEVNWSQIPIIVESANRDSEHSILYLADQFSKQVYCMPYKNRLKLHLAAVLVNNFTNALYVSAQELISENTSSKDLSFDMLFPLIDETTRKVKHLDPKAAQTGPAKRKDTAVMKKHLKLIEKNKELEKVYKQISKLIIKQQK